MLRNALRLTAALSAAAAASAQTERVNDPNFNAWIMYFGDHAVSERWGVHLEGQWRRHDGITRPQQLLLRPAVNFKVNDNVMLTAGYGFVETSRAGDFPPPSSFPEHRVFEQVVLNHDVGKTSIQHRYRLEQRYIGEAVPDGMGGRDVRNFRYENRFRYMFRLSRPIGGTDWFWAGYNEFMINFGENVAANTFDQNRAYGAVGKNFGKPGRLELGYLLQIVQQRNGRVFEFNHTLQAAWFSNFSFRSSGR